MSGSKDISLSSRLFISCLSSVSMQRDEGCTSQPDDIITSLGLRNCAGVELESAGGTVQLVRTAAPSGVGLMQLEEALLLQVGFFPLHGNS